jgi:transcriptional regulator with XRE-family HTH domain
MIQEKLKNLRKQKGMSQEKMAKILATDTSNYSRKERGETRIHDEEWQKIADALEVPIEDIKEEKGIGNYNHYYSTPNSIIENLQDYISLLKKEIENLKEENKSLKTKI